jgi:CRISPR-associated protein Csc3
MNDNSSDRVQHFETLVAETDQINNTGGEETEGEDEDEGSPIVTYVQEIDPKLIERGWHLTRADIERGTHPEQTTLNRVRNGVFVLEQFNSALSSVGATPLRRDTRQEIIGTFIARVCARSVVDNPPATAESVAEFAAEIGLDDYSNRSPETLAAGCSSLDISSDTDNDPSPVLRYARLVEALASCPTPERATSTQINELVAALPEDGLSLHYHSLDDYKGVFSNLINQAVAQYLSERRGYSLLAIYQDGCIYLSTDSAQNDTTAIEDGQRSLAAFEQSTDQDADTRQAGGSTAIESIAKLIESQIPEAHPAYQDIERLSKKLDFKNSVGYFDISGADFFFAEPADLLRATLRRGLAEGDPADEDLTEAMQTSFDAIDNNLGDIDHNKQVYYLGVTVDSIRRRFIQPLLENLDTDQDELEALCSVLGVGDETIEAIRTASQEVDQQLTGGGKWQYSILLGQCLVDRHPGLQDESVPTRQIEEDICEELVENFSALDSEWEDGLVGALADRYRNEVQAYLGEILKLDGQLPGRHITDDDLETGDPFDQYHRTSREHLCSLCNRGVTTRRVDDLKTSKSVSSLQAGYSRHIPAGGTQSEKRRMCVPCQIEFSLRNSAASERHSGRLFIHLIPDYFYTPFSWQVFDGLVRQFDGGAGTRIQRLAEAVFTASDAGARNLTDELGTVLENLCYRGDGDDPGGRGRSMLETLDRGFSAQTQFGSRTVGYYKDIPTRDGKGNETEFQFFGTFIGLAIAAYSGSRIYISDSPIPEMRSRDFPAFARLGSGLTSVEHFFGTDLSLDELSDILRRAAALILLGYEYQNQDDSYSQRNDSQFKRYLRLTRTHRYPGSHLLKRALSNVSSDRADGSESALRLTIAERISQAAEILDATPDKRFIIPETMTDSTHDDIDSPITYIADQMWNVLRPESTTTNSIEKPLREMIKAVNNLPPGAGRDDQVNAAAAKLQKMPDRSQTVFPVGHEDADLEGNFEERCFTVAEAFVDLVLIGEYEGNPGQLKRDKNEVADAYYAATIRFMNRQRKQRMAESNGE